MKPAKLNQPVVYNNPETNIAKTYEIGTSVDLIVSYDEMPFDESRRFKGIAKRFERQDQKVCIIRLDGQFRWISPLKLSRIGS